MKLFKYAIIKRRELTQLRNSCARTDNELLATQAILKQIQNKEWSSAMDHSNVIQNDALSKGLVSLIEDLQGFSSQEQHRNWINDGLLEVNKALGRNYTDIARFSDDLVRVIVNYTKANQGALFITNQQDPKNAFLEMHGCYAYQRKKSVEKRIDIGEGLIGQCYLEGDPVYMTNLPSDYVKITSGLGEALPRCLVIIPLVTNQKKVGVFELAFFRALQPHEREFLIKVSESIATFITNLQANTNTLKLLAQSENIAHELKQNQEELRQNLEEMQAIQEDLSRKKSRTLGGQAGDRNDDPARKGIDRIKAVDPTNDS